MSHCLRAAERERDICFNKNTLVVVGYGWSSGILGIMLQLIQGIMIFE